MNQRKKIYISSVTFGIVSILLIFFAIYPVFRDIKKKSQELLLEKENLILLSEEIKDLERSKKFYEAQRTNLEKINNLFIDQEIPIEFIRFLEKNATDYQLSIEISPIKTTKKENDLWPSLSFQISTNGTFPDFLKFLEKLENSPYLIEILNLNLKGITEKEVKVGAPLGSVNALFLIKVFSK